MPIRGRTTKSVARRHDLNYFKRLSPIRALQWWLACGALAVALLWLGISGYVHGNRAFSAGPMSSSHAVFGQRCELCHVPVIRGMGWMPVLGMRKRVPDSACLSCHVAPAHHPQESAEAPTCGSCHVEHTGSMHLAAVADRSCTQCHAQLTSRTGELHVAASIHSFATDHPGFQPLRLASDADRSATFGLKFSHAEHMQHGLTGPNGPTTLQCADCHAPTIELAGFHAGQQGAAMGGVTFEKNCRTCHTLQFDAHIAAEAPHADAATVRAFVTQQITTFAQTHPQAVADEIHHWPATTPLPGEIAMPAPRTQQEWIANRIVHSERILWRQKCGLCHKETGADTFTVDAPLPTIARSAQPQRWFASAVFDHAAHRAVACEECHTQALTSTNGDDILLPSIATCRKCHDGATSPQGPAVKIGHAESGCFLCHVYHGWDESGVAPHDGLRLDQLN
jgi:hypothetical protein